MNIGNWVRRATPGTKYHLVESVVAQDAVTRCGRRLRNETGPLEVRELMPLTREPGQPQLCRQCHRTSGFCGDTSSHLAHGTCPGFGVVTAPEDDGSTAPIEDVP